MEQQFAFDWFSTHITNWNNYLFEYKDKPNLNFLEIGSHEGRSSSWLLDNILTHETSKMHCIDIFYDDGYKEKQGISIKERFLSNMKKHENKITIYEEWSFDRLIKMISKKMLFDFIYIDGNHYAKNVLQDSVLSFKILKNNSIMIFDDYDWNKDKLPVHKRPEMAIDAFLEAYSDEISILHTGKQVIIRKK